MNIIIDENTARSAFIAITRDLDTVYKKAKEFIDENKYNREKAIKLRACLNVMGRYIDSLKDLMDKLSITE